MNKKRKSAEDDKVERRKSSRQTSNLSSTMLAQICIFCGRDSKYKKGTNTREPVRCYAKLRVDQKLKPIGIERHDTKLIALTSDELVAKEARYHPSCYKVYTQPVKPLMGQNDTFKIDALRSTIDELLAPCEGHITFVNDVKKTYLKKLEDEGVETKNATKNLRRSIERNCSDVQFLIVDNEEVICPNTITMEEILSLFFKKQKKLEQLKNVEENIYSSAVAIRKEFEEYTYNRSWPPLCNVLDMDCFPVSPSPRKSLSLVICNDAAPNNDKTERIISLLSQHLFYAVHEGKKLTPKSIPLQLLIKLLTSNTELISTVSRPGRGVSYTKLGEVITEVTCSSIDNNVDTMICLPEKCKKGYFTMLVEDNIDRNEETLTRTHFLLQKIAGLDIKILLNYITLSGYYINLLFDFYLK